MKMRRITYWLLSFLLLLPLGAAAQINISGKVFGGARQADVEGHTYVNIGSEKHDVVIDYVFGGNDIAGTIGSSGDPASADKLPTELTHATENGINNSWNAIVKLSDGPKKLYIGQLFGGGYGNYTYKNETTTIEGKKNYDVDLTYTVWDPTLNSGAGGLDYNHAVTLSSIVKPELGKTYLEICGGSIVYAYGGGNNVTVTNNTTICYDNPSTVVNSIKARNADGTESATELLTEERFIQMGINTKFSQPSSDAFQVGRFFGGNNKADMAIRPMWNLQQGKIRNLYSGGNEGRMTSPVGILLEIKGEYVAVPAGKTLQAGETYFTSDTGDGRFVAVGTEVASGSNYYSTLTVDNVYGGCRKADVRPLSPENGQDMGSEQIVLDHPVYKFPNGLSARTVVMSGDINNVYGGNDITGRVYGGNAVGVHCSIRGSIYGGGNGSYPYTDNDDLKTSQAFGDVYYDVRKILNLGENASFTGLQSAKALNLFRPNAEQVSIRVGSSDAAHPTVIGGAIYLGGNSATLQTERNNPMVELKVGSYVIADKVFLGNNGENMIKYNEENKVGGKLLESEGVLRTMRRTDLTSSGRFNSMDLTDPTTFAKYMDGCAMSLVPSVTFDQQPRDPEDYIPYSSYFGSFYCGGNVGSITRPGKIKIDFDKSIIVYDKVVGGCNDAYVLAVDGFRANYQGGIIGSEAEQPATLGGEPRFADASGNIKDRLELNFNGLKIMPLRTPIAGVDDAAPTISTNIPLVWNTVKLGERDSNGDHVPVAWNNNTWSPATAATATEEAHTALYNSTVNRRFTSGNIYGGCCNSGVVNGNVVININATIVDRTGAHGVFDIVATDDETGEDKLYGNAYTNIQPVSGVILGQQGMDVLGSALNIFGGGKGLETEIWGSASVNLKRGYVFQIFGGSEQGAIGKRKTTTTGGVTTDNKDTYGNYVYDYNEKYSTYVNLAGSGSHPGVPKSQDLTEDIAEAEFLYGGGFEGAIAGNTHINLDNGRIFNSFAGSCNANIQGHAETIIGANGFPYVRDYVYGGNDLGGKILGSANFQSRVRNSDVLSKVHGYHASTNPNPAILNASAYIEYLQGRVEKIFGGCYGVYDYADSEFGDFFYATGGTGTTDANRGKARPGFSKPFLEHAFINFRPMASNNELNAVNQVYGAGQGYLGEEQENELQNSSYILVDAQSLQNFQKTEIFGAGESGGVGMNVDLSGDNPDYDQASAIIDLISGQFKAVYGGSYQEGVTRRTVVNVPEGSTFRGEKIFGGAYGVYQEYPCDVYESIVNWNSSDALVGNYRTGIYGGNNNCRRTLYSKVNINAPVYYDKVNQYYGTVYGAGYGADTWSQYTEVNLNGNADPTKEGARVYEAYGGGQLGRVMNIKSVAAWKTATDTNTKKIDLSIGYGYTDNGLQNALATYKYNTNVRINKGASVCGYMYNGSLSGAYAYGGGLGNANTPNTGDVHGTTFVGLFGGTVAKDIYAAGTVGSVNNRYNVTTDDFGNPFVATANAYIEGGTARNVYGGGWQGSVGYHVGDITTSYASDIPGQTNVIIGKLDGTDFINGIPAIERNAYGGGEGGAVWGTTHITLNKGFIGYRFFDSLSSLEKKDGKVVPYETVVKKDGDDVVWTGYYQEKLHDETWSGDGTNRLNDSGCIFGGGYIDNSSVDITNVTMYGGHVRNSLFGGGEIAAIGRGKINASGVDFSVRTLQGIYKAGKTNVDLFNGHVHRNVFGGGRGYNNLGEGGTLFSDGYVFGQTEVHVHGGEIGTTDELAQGNGNVFGGGDIGYVYSAYEQNGNLYYGKKPTGSTRYDNGDEGYYYKSNGTSFIDDNGTVLAANAEKILTEDCKVLVEPHCQVTAAGGASFTGIHYPKGFVVSSIDLDYLREKNITGIDANGKVTATGGITFNRTYAKGEYVPMAALNTLGNKNTSTADWGNLDVSGVIIHNAVFAGGNTTAGSSLAYANATSVFGNATASIYDAYHRDLITVGTGHTGGLYGDGNLTFVDGYRGLNITNYGTDYYTISSTPEISLETYRSLDPREAAYYQLTYKCIKACTDDDGTDYHPAGGEFSKASTLTLDDILTLFKNNTAQNNPPVINANGTVNTNYWQENGVCTIYAGRLMNTIQRADFCGVFGSRMVMQGAQDRVPETVDYTNYTINRVREVSLNQQHSIIDSDLTLKPGATSGSEDYVDVDKAIHGNYFGIYNIVNYLGALSSDVHFSDIRQTDNTSNPDAFKSSITVDGHTYAYGSAGATYYNWKRAHKDDRTRNNGSSHNKVALASGVYLELTTEESTGKELNEKVWGHVTGVIELDLINVQTGMGGGFVYAKNEHRTWTYNKKEHATLTALNAEAITQKDFDYTNTKVEWETSGNFVHSTQTIIDDCYNVSGKYDGADAVPAHYWYIKGSVYVYDQYISAYTGASNAYSETVDIPLTITAASHGTMKLLNVKPNKYAYKNSNGQKLADGQKLVINDVTYYLNDPISYWDWYLLTKSEQALFVDETYVTTEKCKIGNTIYPAGYVMLPDEYSTLQTSATTQTIDGKSVKAVQKVVVNENGQDVVATDDNNNIIYRAFDAVFHSSNNLSHETGYILTYKVNNPIEWNTWYTKAVGNPNEKLSTEQYDAQNKPSGYEDGPTYHLNSTTGSLLGQQKYAIGNLIPESVYNTYQSVVTNHAEVIPHPSATDANYEDTKQASFERAYIVTQKIDADNAHFNPGTTMSATQAASYSSSTAPALICTSTIQLSTTEFIYINAKMTQSEKDAYINEINTRIIALGISDPDNITSAEIAALSVENKKKLSELRITKEDIQNRIVPAYYCTDWGMYGGDYYQGGKNYRALTAWSSMSAADRTKFAFNYDALDLLIDHTYGKAEGKKYQYDGAYDTEAEVKNATTGNPAGYSITRDVDYSATYNGTETTTHNGVTLANGTEYPRKEFEKLPNEKRHYAPISVTEAGTIYVVNRSIQIGNTPYAVGSTITSNAYSSLSDTDKEKITAFTFTNSDVGKTYYYCRESYAVNENTEGQSVTNTIGTHGFNSNGEAVSIKTGAYGNNEVVPVGLVIDDTNYNNLPNRQLNFTIHGIAPTETSTLYVSRNSDINDLSTEKIITVIYEYDYEESDASAAHVTPISERHVLNIHIQFKSGSPIVEDIRAPQIIIPGDFVGLREPNVIPGATEVTGGGWELFEKASDAESHVNGIEYTPNLDPLYWYQDGYWVAYYALSYIGGKTYSNNVQVSVANYHDLKKVMEDKDHHYYVDNPNVKRDSKIYINDSSNGAQQLKDLFDLSMLTTTPTDNLAGHALLDPHVKAAKNLEFFMHTNVNHTGDWTPIANNTGECFEGTLHGDGYYFNGLNNSLFGHLCGSVYNLGVMGSFTSAGIADTGTGYVENCWIKTDATSGFDSNTYAVFGNPSAGSSVTQIVNCYYPEAPANLTGSYYKTGLARPMEARAFHNGTVAYDLNGFYLYKRYYDKQPGTTGTEYKYYTVNPADDKLSAPKTEYYGENITYCSSGYNGGKYVEDRFADGDFRYSSGEIPAAEDERIYKYKETVNNTEVEKTTFLPIWPDDYIYFGQMLTYGWNDSRPHEEVPSHIVKNSGRLPKTDQSNRVYRAPAYYRNATMDVAHFNPAVNLVAYSKPLNAADVNLHPAYPNMTAIDFKGHNDLSYTLGWTQSSKLFYPPLLDDDGLMSIVNRDETPNLLVYAPSAEANLKTNTVLNGYFTEPAYADYQTHPTYEPATTDYRCVDPAPTETVFGHLVQSSLTTTNDHLLVDMKDFNCPIDYHMGNSNHMWYQRVPKTYVDLTKGWESVSLPFKAELVTTNEKGEITHFYSGSKESNNGTKIGHEYWLHEYSDISMLPAGATGEQKAEALFQHPEKVSGSSKTVDNTFLWDYYYKNANAQSGNQYKDKNLDTYQIYYNTSRTYNGYPLLANGTPYLIGFPGATYYEFDLSGTFEALTTADDNPEKIGEQTISFVSDGGYHVGVSDGETLGVTFNGYTFKTSYMNEMLEAGTNSYALSDDGSQYVKVPAQTTPPAEPVAPTRVAAFRPYFVKASGGNARQADYILFDNANSSFGDADSDPSNGEVPDGTLYIYAKTGKVVVESSLRNEADVSIYTTSGLLVSSFTIKPGETIETPINLTGIYITRAANGRFTKKLKVKR